MALILFAFEESCLDLGLSKLIDNDKGTDELLKELLETAEFEVI